MKQLSLIFLFVCMVFGARAATISGTITNGTTSSAASGVKVYLYDSSTTISPTWGARDSAITSSTGTYSFTYTRTSGAYRLLVNACGMQYWSSYGTYNSSNHTVNMTICTPITASGSVNYTGGGSVAAPLMKVYLIDTLLTGGNSYRDSTLTSVSGTYSFTVPATVGLYRIYAKACGGQQWSSSYYTRSSGNSTINLTLGCTGVAIIDTVRNVTTNAPVYQQKVYLVDSSAIIYRLDSALTDKRGVATFIIPPGSLATSLRVYTNACGVQQHIFAYSGTSVTAPNLLICLSSAVISGTLTNASTSLPVPYWQVSVSDSFGTARLFYDSLYTNSAGAFSTIVPVGINTGTMIAATNACAVRVTNRSTFTGSNLTLNLSVCATSTATVSGTVTDAVTSASVAGHKVYLLDSTGTTIYRDSTTTNASGNYSFAIPPSIMSAWLTISTRSCGFMQYTGRSYTGTSISSVNWSISTATPKTISGTIVTNTGAAAGGIQVTLYSSGWSTLGTVTTNSAGGYSMNIPCTQAAPSDLLLATYWATSPTGCYYVYRRVPYAGTNISRVDTLCYTFPNAVSGTVTKQGAGAAANAKVYLILKYIDTSVTPAVTMLKAFDSTITNASGKYYFTNSASFSPNSSFQSLHAKAALQPTDISYNNFLPTYHDSALLWSAADTIFRGYSAPTTGINISLRGGTNPGGPGFIGGNVLLGANKSSAVGDPLAQRILLLTDASDKAIAYAYSNASGRFSFSNLPLGTYKIFGDAWGKTNPALTVILSATKTSINNIVFEENSINFEGKYISVGVAGTPAMAAVRIYPNPVKDRLLLSGLDGIKGDKSLVLRNVTGAIVSENSFEGNASEIATDKLATGVYLLQLQTVDGVANFRFVKE